MSLSRWAALAAVAAAGSAFATIDPEHQARAADMIDRAIDFLRAAQDEATGGWNVQPTGPQLPAITGLVLIGMLDQPGIDAHDPAVQRGVEFLLSFLQPDGGIHDGILPSYNSSIALSALSRLDSPTARAAIPALQSFLRNQQFGAHPAAEHAGAPVVAPGHPFYGGVGYGRHGRPDLSNLAFMLQAMHDSGVPGDDEVFQRAIVFLQRTQMLDEWNDMPYADGSRQGGFIYSTSVSGDDIGNGQSFAGSIEETLDDGTRVSRLRAYGSMTYAGFKSYVYADLARDDPRVLAALDWIRRHYTLDENPGLGVDGLYYYFLTFARALDAWGEPTIDVTRPDGSRESRDWANDLIDRLGGLQEPDGGFRPVGQRWMEGDRVLITAYALIALQHAAR